jgi:hypothetical protein
VDAGGVDRQRQQIAVAAIGGAVSDSSAAESCAGSRSVSAAELVELKLPHRANCRR